MWNKTRASELLKIQYPIIQGPFGGRFSSVKLLSEVSNAGGLGSFGLNAYQPDEIRELGKEIKAATQKPYNLNLWVPLKEDPLHYFKAEDFEKWKREFLGYFEALDLPDPEMPVPKKNNFEEQVEAMLEVSPPVASFIFGVPDKEVLKELKKSGITSMAAATTVEEALVIEDSAVDIVLLTGQEAGGHRPSFLKAAEASLANTEDLVKKVLPKIRKPIVAAGGISNGQRAGHYFNMGVAAVQIGTAFLACDESGASTYHKQLLRSENVFHTHLSRAFTGRLARTISNRFSSDFNGMESGIHAPYPLQSQLLSPLMKEYREQHKMDYVAHWAGEPAEALKETQATVLFKKLIEDIEHIYFPKND